MEVFRKRNTATTIYFPMIVYGATDFAIGTDWTPVAADCQYSKDGAAFGNTNSAPVHEGNGIWSLALLAGEIDGGITAIAIVDSATKAVEDQALLVATYGDSSSEHDLSIIADFVIRRTLANARASGDGDSVAFRSMLGALSKLVNKIEVSGSDLLVREENDTTTFGTQAITSTPGADPITALDTT